MSDRLRRYLLEKANYTCEIPGCGCNFINPYTNLSILQIHHIDGDATNNKEENLQVLCPNHHAMTEHFGSIVLDDIDTLKINSLWASSKPIRTNYRSTR
jgi:hypothetical protein